MDGGTQDRYLPSTRFREEEELKRPTTTRNYLEQEAQNRSLGLAGEKLILDYEHHRLWQAGKHKLADSIEHVSVTQGDGLGFDILSYEPDGSEKLIEVKTTRYGAMTPFFATRTEVEVSKEHSRNYFLHRLFDFNKRPRVFGLQGALPSTCRLEPFTYSALPK